MLGLDPSIKSKRRPLPVAVDPRLKAEDDVEFVAQA